MAMDIEELEKNVRLMFSARGNDQKLAQQQLNLFKEDPNSWLMVDKVLKESKFEETKYLALQVLDNVIMTRWKILPKEQQLGIRNFVVDFIIKTSESEATIKENKTLLNKLDLVLVSILKQEWPHNWPTFISEIVSACHTSLTICENNMSILRLLSEEVFDYSAEQMTSAKTEHLKETMSSEFSSIFQLCTQILETANQPTLIKATLETLLRFLNWIPLGYIFQTGIITTLRTRFLEPAQYRNLTMKCLIEISGFQNPGKQYDESLIEMFTNSLETVSRIIPLHIDLKSTYPGSSSSDQEFVLNLALFITTFFTNHLKLIENLPNQDYLKHAHFYLVRISQVDDREIFKICLEYWTKLASELYDETQAMPFGADPLMMSPGSTNGFKNGLQSRKTKYDDIMSPLRTVMIEKMLKPEEVLIVENDEGEIVRETIKESDTTQLAEAVRQCLVFLTHLDVMDTETIMADKLGRQVDGTEWSWQNCNTLCWAIGSISGAMNEETEKRFLVGVIKDLLGLTEQKRGKDNKAVVASNIMYIVGQYPRFLKAHWKFLKTVVNKLFEFMHESHEGVQDMACDTFLKIAKSCRRHFVVLQTSESEPFIDEIVRTMSRITEDLEPHQVHTFYKACGFMINAQGQKSIQERLISDLMAPANHAWDHIIEQAKNDPSCLQDGEMIKVIGNIMKTNVAACDSIRNFFYPQIKRIYQDMLTMYRATSGMISEAVQTNGPIATKTPRVRGLRTIKKEILKLIETYLERSEDLDLVNTEIVPPLLDAVLVDYNQNVPDAREAEVLRVMTVVIEKLQGMMDDKIPIIMANVFECTLNMINKDFSDYPEHRLAFFAMLRVINLYCFNALLRLDQQQFKFIIDSCLWAIKHDNRDVESAGLLMCIELMQNISEVDAQTANSFFRIFYLLILQDVFYVLTDSDHKSGFKQQSTLLADMFRLVSTNKISAPLYQDHQASPGTSNVEFLTNFVTDLLRRAFANLQEAQIKTFVAGLFTLNEDPNKFRIHLRDFLIQMKEYNGDNAELFEAEREKEAALKEQLDRDARSRVGGLMRPNEIKDEDEL